MQIPQYLSDFYSRMSANLEERAKRRRVSSEATTPSIMMRMAERWQRDAETLRAAAQILRASEYLDAADLAGEPALLSAAKIFGSGHYQCGG